MKKEIVKLKKKIVDPNKFFRKIVVYFKKNIGIKNIYFLMPKQEAGDFILKYPINGSNICITRNELKIVSFYGFKEIVFLTTELKQNDYIIINRILFARLKWKIWVNKISAIMPIYLNDEIICLALFKGRLSDNWFDINSKHLNKMKSIIEYCLGAIVLYNQAVGRIIRKYQ